MGASLRFMVALAVVLSLASYGMAAVGMSDEEVETRLDKAITVEVDQVALARVLTYVGDVTGCKMGADWQRLEGAGVDKNLPVSVHFKELPAREVLRWVLRQAEGGRGRSLEASVQDGGVIVTMAEVAPKVKKTYRVGDLVNNTESQQREFVETIVRITDRALEGGNDGVPGEMRLRAGVLQVTQTARGQRAVAEVVATMRAARCRAPQIEPARMRTLKQLQANGSMTFESVKFSEALDAFLKANQIKNCYVDWKSLEGAGIDRNTPVTLKASAEPAGKTLQRILDVSGEHLAGSTVDKDGVLMIASSDAILRESLTRRVYDVRGLVLQASRFGGSEASTEDRARELFRIVEGVDPLVWRDNGGEYGSVRFYQDDGMLLIEAPLGTQEKVGALLTKR